MYDSGDSWSMVTRHDFHLDSYQQFANFSSSCDDVLAVVWKKHTEWKGLIFTDILVPQHLINYAGQLKKRYDIILPGRDLPPVGKINGLSVLGLFKS